MPVTIMVPAMIISGFAVAADRLPTDLPALLRRALPAPFTTAATERLGTPSLKITPSRAADSAWDLSRAAAADEDDRAKILRADWHIGIASELPAGDLPLGLHLARATAKAIAETLCGVPIDLDSGQVLPADPVSALDEFRLADGWLGASLPPYRNAGHCPADDDDIDGCTCVDLTTRGLHRFGLPELEITDVACPHDVAALNILRTTAQRLLPLGRHPGDHVLPSEIPLTGEDFAAFWGARDPMWDDGPVPVRLIEESPRRLSIRAPDDFPGTLNEWLWDELPPILHDLLICEPDGSPTPG
ncbi:hypothetical protein [Actinomadura roseirufa]|uniref:hypothetical protein n=1 Tax=Actinomadura roseirufa TaxID=2094049 RepID=UPI001041ABDE|nr:hypothetical protein [Actinomadura roseirufa]